MIKTSIILKLEQNFPVWHNNDGLAKNKRIAKWLFEYSGWKTKSNYPSLALLDEVIDSNEDYSFENHNEIFILNSRLILN